MPQFWAQRISKRMKEVGGMKEKQQQKTKQKNTPT